MAKPKVAEMVGQLAQPVVEAAGMELVDVEFLKEAGRWYLRIYIDKPDGVGLDDCQEVSREVERLLDEKDPIPHAYILEVSSPGLERPLNKAGDYLRFAGRLTTITTFAPVSGRKKITGRLKGLRESDVVIQVEDEEITIPLVQVASARLALEL